MCRASGGYGTWKIDTAEDYEYWMTQIGKTMPYAETILTEMVENVKQNMCCHMYVSRKGDVTWLAVTEKIMDDDGIWIGAVMQVYDSLFPFYAASDRVATTVRRGIQGLLKDYSRISTTFSKPIPAT